MADVHTTTEAAERPPRAEASRVMDDLVASLDYLRSTVPPNASPLCRAWKVSVTEMEKVVAYFHLYVEVRAIEGGANVAGTTREN